jgi:hypothetical protein
LKLPLPKSKTTIFINLTICAGSSHAQKSLHYWLF